MHFKLRRLFLVRCILILILLAGLPGVRGVQAAPGGADRSLAEIVLITVQDTDGMPMPGLNVYAFSGTTYTGLHGITDSNGQLALQLPEGAYRFRADRAGTQFWSGTANHCDVPGCSGASVTVSNPLTVTVLDTDGAPQAELKVYAFNGSTYTGYNKTTNAEGQAVFTLPLGSYRFRADLNGTQFWSGTANHCDIPGCGSTNITVSQPTTVTVLDTSDAPKAGLNVYAFNGSTYTGYSKTTDANGQAIFTLPSGSYRFRADLNGTQFWSGTANHCDIPGCSSASVTVSHPMTVILLDTDGAAKAGLNVYAFNTSTYTGYSKTTNAAGQAVFTLPMGSYRFRADVNGTQFWSGATNHCDIPGCESAQVTVTIPVTLRVQDAGGVSKAGVNVYAFQGSTYTGYSKVSDANGQAVFTLPQGSYRFRADYSGAQYWSDSTNHCTLPGCLSAAVTVGPPMTATPLPTNTPTATATATLTSTPTFTPTPVLLTISGNAGVSGAVLSYMENGISRTVTANSTGSYTISVASGWSGTVTPSKANVSFSPMSRTYASVQANTTAQDYAATITVIHSNSSGPGSFVQAITEAASGATIRFAPSLAGRTIALSSPVVLNSKKLIINGSGLSPQVTIHGGGNAGFLFNGMSSMDIYDLTFANFNDMLRFRTDAVVRNSTFKGFTSGAIFAYGFLTVSNSTFENNGGDAIVSYGPLTIDNSTITKNLGVGILSTGSLLLEGTTVYQNEREALLVNGGEDVTIVNSTIAHNQTEIAAIRINGGVNADILNTTVVADIARAVLFNSSGVLNIYNTVLLCEQENECLLVNAGTVNEVNSLVVAHGTPSAVGLGELASNGGKTLTMALLPGSHLLDAGNDSICANAPVNNVDQRGVTRPQGAHCDIGAYEANGIPAPSVTPTLIVTQPATYTPTRTPTLPVTPTPTFTPFYTPTFTPTITLTPTITSTPVLGCNSLADQFVGMANPIQVSRRTMYLDINNPNPYPVMVSSLFVRWNYSGGGIGGELKLQSVQVGSTTVWTGSVAADNFTINSFLAPVILPAGAITRVTFNFDRTYARPMGEELQLNFSTPGCETYPVHVTNP